MLSKIFGSVAGTAILAYGALQLWASHQSPKLLSSSMACRLWLCPDEFSYAYEADLQQQSESGNTEYPLREFERQVALDPASAYAWADLGESEVNAKRPDLARYCFKQALSLGPKSPVVLTRAGNLCFRLGDNATAMRYFRQVLDNPELRDYFAPVFLTYSRMGLPIERILRDGVPKKPFAARSFLEFIEASGDVPDAEKTWDWFAANSLADGKTASQYISFLLQNKAFEHAAEAWEQFNSRLVPGFRKTNWVYDGSFEQEPSDSPLDWHVASVDDVRAARSREYAFEGNFSLRLEFAGEENVDFHSVYQEAVIGPGKWRFSAHVKTSGITTNEGVALRIFDTASPGLDVRTAALNGTNDWTQIQKEFDAGPQTRLVRVEVMRQPSQRFDNKIAGTAWIDSVDLSPIR